jgi:hypothetical protein
MSALDMHATAPRFFPIVRNRNPIAGFDFPAHVLKRPRHCCRGQVIGEEPPPQEEAQSLRD